MRRSLLLLAGFILALLAAAVVHTHLLADRPRPEARVGVAIDEEGAVRRLAEAVRVPTVSTEDGTIDHAAFAEFHELLRRMYPLVHARLSSEVVGDLSLLYTWPGTDEAAAPVVLMGHFDVVPVVPGTEGRWTRGPFSGEVADGFIWGRGTLDDKVTVIAVLDAVEHLLRDGHTPARTVYLAFGHDEEVGGAAGAGRIAALYKERGLTPPALVLDEGGALFDDGFPAVADPVALVGIAEKGFLSLELRVGGEGGHSSTPPSRTHIGRLARAVAALESSPFPASIDGPTRAMFETLAAAMSYPRRLAIANLWLFEPVVTRLLLQDARAAAMMRTTTAATIFHAGTKSNVLPPEARAVINFRIGPNDTIDSVTTRVKAIIADPEIAVQTVGFRTEPSPVSDPKGAGFRHVAATIRETLGRQTPLVAPYLVIGGTDARYWSGLSTQVFRFNPVPAEPDVTTRAHGTDERVSVAGFVGAVRFYVRLIGNLERGLGR